MLHPASNGSHPKTALLIDGAAMRCRNGGAKQEWLPPVGINMGQNK
jgi:hypothetical protein